MSYKTFSIDDFSGGLNTAVAQSRLDVRFSPDLQNVDFTDTGAITRRKGYTVVTPSAFSSPVRALHRYYKANGARYWLTVSGTAVYSAQAVATEVQPTTLEAESATVSGSVTSVLNADSSGGYYVKIVGASAVFSIPSYCTRIDLHHGCSALVGASVSVDGGAYINATGPILTIGSIGGTQEARTVKVKPTPRNTTSGRMISNSSTLTSTMGKIRTVDTLASIGAKAVSVKFYDTMFTTLGTGRITFKGNANADYTDGIGIGLLNTASTYQVRYDNTYVVSNVVRSVGWHTLTLKLDANGTSYGLLIDNIRVGTYTFTGATLYLRATLQSSSSTAIYLDSISIGKDLYDDFATVTAWSDSGTTHTQDASFATSTTYADTTSFYTLDKFVYSALGTFTKQNGTLSASTDQFSFATLNDKAYFNSPYDTLLSFDGTSVAVVSGTQPRGGFLIEHKRRLWTSGDYADTSMLSYCDVDEPEDWVGGGDIRLAGKDSGGRCTGIAPFDNKVFYFSDSRIYAIDPTGPDTNWTASMAGYNAISWSLGCIAPKSLVQTDNALIFLSADGVRAYGYIPGLYSQDGSGLIDLSENIRPTLDTISHAMRDKAAGAFYNGRYYLACALDGATSNNAILVYTLPTQGKPGAWTKYVGTDTKPLSVTCFAVTRGDEYGLYAGTTGGHIIRLDDGLSDDGENIVMVYKTPQLAPNGFETIKHFSTLHLAGESSAEQSLSIKIDTDDVEIGTVSAQFGSGTAAQPVRLSISSRGRSVQYTLTGSGQAQPLTISRLTTQYHAQKVR